MTLRSRSRSLLAIHRINSVGACTPTHDNSAGKLLSRCGTDIPGCNIAVNGKRFVQRAKDACYNQGETGSYCSRLLEKTCRGKLVEISTERFRGRDV